MKYVYVTGLQIPGNDVVVIAIGLNVGDVLVVRIALVLVNCGSFAEDFGLEPAVPFVSATYEFNTTGLRRRVI